MEVMLIVWIHCAHFFQQQKDPFSLQQSLSVGQVLAVSVVKASQETVAGATRKRIQVSALPASLNNGGNIQRGRITSIQDHGCLVDLGQQKTGFLSFENVEGDFIVEEDSNDTTARRLNPGRLYDFVVRDEASSTAKVVPLSLPSVETMARKTMAGDNMTLHSLTPGMLVNARVEAFARNGLCVAFMGNVFRGSIEMSHLGGAWIPKTRQQEGSTVWKEVFTAIPKFPARILAVDAATKVVRLSLLPHLLQLKVPSEPTPSVGTVVEGATVVRLDPGVGALLALPHDEQDVELCEPLVKNESYVQASKIKTAYVHISKANDGRTPEAEFSKAFAPSTTHTLRILNTSHLLEGVPSCATAAAIVEAHVLTHADLIPGKVYQNVPVCGQLEGGSVMVDFGMGIRGIIPQMHLFDHSVKSEFRGRLRKEKFEVGNKVNVRILSVNVEHKKCLVTAKKTLLKAKDSIVNYRDIVSDQTATGFISKVDDRGLYVTFYNQVYGKVTARSLAAELGVENHRNDYNVGDVVQCRVINCKKRSGKHHQDDMDLDDNGRWDLNLSLNLHPSGEAVVEEDSDKKSRQVQLEAGAVLPEKSMRVVEIVDSIVKKEGHFIPGHAIVRIKSKYLVKEENAEILPHVECKLPFDQLLDSYSDTDIESAESLDRLAKGVLTVGKKIDHKGLVLSDPKKSSDEYSSGLGRLPIVSLRPNLIATAEAPSEERQNDFNSPLLPNDDTHLFMGAHVQGYVTQVNPRHGSFVRFLNKVTGLVPKVKKGLNLPKYGTVTCRIVALDVSTTPPKILLTLASKDKKSKSVAKPPPKIKPGDLVGDAEVVDCNFYRARVTLLDDKYGGDSAMRARVHVTMTESPLLSGSTEKHGKKKKKSEKESSQQITKHHPFYKWKKGTKLTQLTCVAVDVRDGVAYVELTNRNTSERESSSLNAPPTFIENSSQLSPGMKVSAVITSVSKQNKGVWVQVSPGISGYIPALELSTEVTVLNNMPAHYPLGARVDCCVLEKDQWEKNKHRGSKAFDGHDEHDAIKAKKHDGDVVFLSLLRANANDDETSTVVKPVRGDLVVGRINRKMMQQRAPALMLDLRGGFVGRCCITELEEVDDWGNMPLGRMHESMSHGEKEDQNVVTDEEVETERANAEEDKDEESEDEEKAGVTR
jgi:ribosomal protein S1